MLIIATLDACYAFGFIYVVSEIGQQTSNDFDELLDEFMELDWYLFPEEIKQMLPTILINLQEPVIIEIFGKISCCRDNFKKVRSSQIIDIIVCFDQFKIEI